MYMQNFLFVKQTPQTEERGKKRFCYVCTYFWYSIGVEVVHLPVSIRRYKCRGKLKVKHILGLRKYTSRICIQVTAK